MKAAGLMYVTGPMGAGKSLYGVRRILWTIMHGRYVITNIQLIGHWAEKLSRRTPQGFVCYFLWRSKFRKIVAFYESLYIFETNLERATAYNPPGKVEGSADLVWDELSKDMNNRTWFEASQNYINQWATHLRKMGYSAFFLVQHSDNTDAALRRIANFHVRLRNQRELVRFPLLGFRLPFHFFLADWVPANVKRFKGEDVIRTERYFRGWQSRCYDTHAIHYDVDEEDGLLGIGTMPLPEPGTMTPEILREMQTRWLREKRIREAKEREAEREAGILPKKSGASVASGARNGKRNGVPKKSAPVARGASVRVRHRGEVSVRSVLPRNASHSTA